MREILFRGKRIDNGDFIEGHLYGIWDKKYILWGQTNHVPNGEEVIPETVGQFTGLTDKNGVKIFEGDIVSYEDISGVEDGVGNVLFDLFYGGWIVFVNDYEENSLADVVYNCEIIGNIHDNPELMTAQKEATDGTKVK